MQITVSRGFRRVSLRNCASVKPNQANKVLPDSSFAKIHVTEKGLSSAYIILTCVKVKSELGTLVAPLKSADSSSWTLKELQKEVLCITTLNMLETYSLAIVEIRIQIKRLYGFWYRQIHDHSTTATANRVNATQQRKLDPIPKKDQKTQIPRVGFHAKNLNTSFDVLFQQGRLNHATQNEPKLSI